MKTYRVTGPDGASYEIDGPEGATDEQVIAQVQAQLQRQSMAPPTAVQRESLQPHTGVVALGETLLNLGTGMISMPIAGLAGLGNVVTNAFGRTNSNPADTVNAVAQGATYQPRTAAGQGLTTAVTYPFAKLAEGADWAGGKVAEATGSPAAGAAVNTAIQAAPMLIGPVVKGVRSARSAPAVGPAPAVGGASPAQGAARVWTAGNTSVDWTRLPAAFQKQLETIAQNATQITPNNAATIERAGRLASLNVPATRGQLTRDPVQLRNEGNVSATTAGKPIRDIYVAQNKALIENLRILKNEQGGVAASDSQTGTAVQEAARAKLAWKKAQVDRLYNAAQNSPETLQLVDSTPLFDLIGKTPDAAQYGWAEGWLKKVGLEPGKGISIRDLESLRQAAVAKTKDGGTAAHYAGKLIEAIDQSTEGAGGRLYQAARQARREQALEFQDQAGVARLVNDKTRTDPAVALEDVFQRTVVTGKISELAAVRKSLLEGGTKKTRTAGEQAWRELRSRTVQDIIDRATRSVSTFEDGTPNLTADALKKGIDNIGKEKIDVLFGPGVHDRLQTILRATQDVKTEPPPGFKGSPTVANFLAFFEKLVTKVPYIGETAVGTVRGVAQLREMGAAGGVVRSATTSPVEDIANQARNSMIRKSMIRKLTDPNALSAAATTVGDRASKK